MKVCQTFLTLTRILYILHLLFKGTKKLKALEETEIELLENDVTTENDVSIDAKVKSEKLRRQYLL